MILYNWENSCKPWGKYWQPSPGWSGITLGLTAYRSESAVAPLGARHVHLHSLGVTRMPMWTTCFGTLESSSLFVHSVQADSCVVDLVLCLVWLILFYEAVFRFRILYLIIIFLFPVLSFYKKITKMIISHFSSIGCERTTTTTVLASEGWWDAWQPPPQGNWGAVSGQRHSWKTPGELGVTKSIECDIIPFSALIWHCWLGDRNGIWPVKSWVLLVCRRWWFDWSFARFISPVITTTSIILCFNEHRLTQVVWLGGQVVRTLDLRSIGCEFESWPLHYRVQPWASC